MEECWDTSGLCFFMVPIEIFLGFIGLGFICGCFCSTLDEEEDNEKKNDSAIR